MSEKEVDLKYYEISVTVEADVTINLRNALNTLELKELKIVRAIVKDMITEQEWENEEKLPDFFFCGNCGNEFSISDLKFTICKETNHVKGICPFCNFDEFSKDDPLIEDEWTEYPEQEFYLRG